MVLWGLAMHADEPEREPRPLGRMADPDIPDYYHQIVNSCLCNNPRDRLSAKELLKQFPPEIELSQPGPKDIQTTVLERQERKYIDPDSAIGLEDIPSLGKDIASLHAPSQISEASYMTFADGTTSSDYMFEGGDSVTQNVEVFPVQSHPDEIDLAKQVEQVQLIDPPAAQVEPSEYFISPSETHLQSPASELSSSTPTLLGPSFMPPPQSAPSEPEIIEAHYEPRKLSISLFPTADVEVFNDDSMNESLNQNETTHPKESTSSTLSLPQQELT